MKKILILSVALSSLLIAQEPVAVGKIEGCGQEIKCKTLSCKYMNDAKKEIKELHSKELYEMIVKDENFFLIDLRTDKQFERGQIDYKNLHNIDRGYLEFKIEEVVKDKDAKIVLYCCTGKRSAISAKVLQDMGYTNVYSLSEGVSQWVDEKFPLLTQYGLMKLSD